VYLTSSPILTPPRRHEDMMLYIAATSTVVSAVIGVEREEEGHVYKVQQLVYYVSKVLIDSKI
jgi:methenyltetrahydromethanopterin cyclohydrolase